MNVLSYAELEGVGLLNLMQIFQHVLMFIKNATTINSLRIGGLPGLLPRESGGNSPGKFLVKILHSRIENMLLDAGWKHQSCSV